MKLYLSITPGWWGGGSHTFAYNFHHWARRQKIQWVNHPAKADVAIIIAARAREEDLREARRKGVFLIHRLDEHFKDQEQGYRAEKHQYIQRLNQYCNVTVFQSEWVKSNVLPHLKPQRHEVILNGGDPAHFRPGKKAGHYIGHVSWSFGDKKRLDLLLKAVQEHPEQPFLFVGNHKKSEYPFRDFINVRLYGRAFRFWIPHMFRQMKVLFFPSQWDPCPNTVVEAILCGLPVAYHPDGGTCEIVKDCGLPIDRFDELLANLPEYRSRCLQRSDLHFDHVARRYLSLFDPRWKSQ